MYTWDPAFLFADLKLPDYIQVLFWLVAGTVAALTYRHARGTLFQPLKVEVFKLQLKQLTSISELYSMRDESDLRNHFDIQNCISFNAAILQEDFARIQFDARPEINLRKKFAKEFPAAILKPHHLQLVLPPTTEAKAAAATETPATPHDWKNHEPPGVWVSAKHTESMDELARLIRDPVTPKDLADLLRQLELAVNQQMEGIGDAISRAATHMPTSYPTLVALHGPLARAEHS